MKEVFDHIAAEFAADKIPGWCPLEKAFDMAATVIALRPAVALEVGVFGGRSLFPVALAMKAVGHGEVIGIDPWSAEASQEGYTGENKAWWGALDHEAIFRGFVANMERLHLQNVITVHRCRSDVFSAMPDIDLLHLDGQHAEQAIREVKKFGPRVRTGGVVFMDDLSWTNDGTNHVGMAVKELLKHGFRELYRRKQPNGEWAAFQKVR